MKIVTHLTKLVIGSMSSILLAGSSPYNLSLQEQLVFDTNTFACHAYPHAAKEGNCIFSPYSVFSCLGMAYVGAAGETASEMADALSIHMSKYDHIGQFAKVNAELLSSLRSKEGPYKLDVANAMWLGQDTQILSDYRHMIRNDFDANIQSLDFSQSKEAVSIINTWISNETQGKIPRLLAETDISSLTRLVLTNAIYFQGSWKFPFQEKLSKQAPFHVTPGSDKPVLMMEQTESFAYHETEQCQFLLLPFVSSQDTGSELACFFLLPKNALSSVESSLSPALIHSYLELAETRRIHMQIPRFTLASKLYLKEVLEQMGMKAAFTKEADFSGIDGLTDLYIDKVLHEAYFACNEYGVSASAATAATMAFKSAGPSPTPPIEFLADHPFLFGIVDLKSKVMLFLGKVVDPNINMDQ